jgi:hypothetical protein
LVELPTQSAVLWRVEKWPLKGALTHFETEGLAPTSGALRFVASSWLSGDIDLREAESFVTGDEGGQRPATKKASRYAQIGGGAASGALARRAAAGGFGTANGGGVVRGLDDDEVGDNDPSTTALARARALVARAENANYKEPSGVQARANRQTVLPANLVEQAMKPGAEGSQAMRLLELQALQAMAAGASRGGGVNPPTDMDFEDLFSGGNGSDLESGGVNMPNGMVTMERVLRAVKKDPERWNLAFDAFLKRHMYADVTGGSYSLFDYLLKRVHFGQDQHDLEKFMHILAAMHALYQRGPEAHEHLGAAIIQAFKACDQYQRDRSWLLAWQWVDLQDPRPGRFRRGLAHPSEFAASLRYVREIQTMESQLAVAKGGGKKGQKGTPKGGAAGDEGADGAGEGEGDGKGAKNRRGHQ